MIRRLFTDIAGCYDRMNRILSLGLDLTWRRKAAALVRDAPQRILDLACGTGDMAFALAERFPAAEIVGVDLTPAMLELARRKNRSPRISFREGDVQVPQTTLGVFDLATCAFGFRNFPDKAAALSAVRRALKPDGRLLVLEFFRSEHAVLSGLTNVWLWLLSAVFARGKASAYAHLRRSMRTTLTAREFVALAESFGFGLVRRKQLFPCCCILLFAWKGGRLVTKKISGDDSDGCVVT